MALVDVFQVGPASADIPKRPCPSCPGGKHPIVDGKVTYYGSGVITKVQPGVRTREDGPSGCYIAKHKHLTYVILFPDVLAGGFTRWRAGLLCAGRTVSLDCEDPICHFPGSFHHRAIAQKKPWNLAARIPVSVRDRAVGASERKACGIWRARHAPRSTLQLD